MSKVTLRIRLLNYLHYKPLSAVHEIPFEQVHHGQCAVARELRWSAEAGLVVGAMRPRDLFDASSREYKEWKLTPAGEAELERVKQNIIIT